jgi:hypothetical protein
MITIVTSRFNNDTWRENCEYKQRLNIQGCIYCSPQQLSSKIHPNSLVFVVEMNNSTNQIQGVGLIFNKIQFDRYYKVYQIGNYNRYTYKSDYRLDRSQLLEYYPALVYILDYILFKEKTHLKRGSGMTQIPEKLLRHHKCAEINIVCELKVLFKRHFTISLEKTGEETEKIGEEIKESQEITI